MTDQELEILGALRDCSMGPGRGDKRFIRDLYWAAERNPDLELTERQRRYLYGLRWRYRRQIPPAVAGVAIAVAEYDRHKNTPSPSPGPKRRCDVDARQISMFG